MEHFRGLLALAATASALAVCVASDSPILARRSAGTILSLGANQSTNWSGYNQGLLEKGGTGFHAISARWTVPSATQHTRGQAEASATWIGIGGGCVDAGCVVGDVTLIQAGTEQDVSASGEASYSTWWEIIPLPQIDAAVPVSPGQTVEVKIAEVLPEIWSIAIKNLTTGHSFSTLVPYTSTYATAEWIEETPLVISTDSGAATAALPNLSTVAFRAATVNGASANLRPKEKLQLVDGNGHVLATPSDPFGGNAFNVCTYSGSC